MLRDTAGQDRIIARPQGWRRHRLRIVLSGIAVIALLLIFIGGARWWSTQRSVAASRLSFATVERGAFVRDIAAEGKVIAAVSPTLYASSGGAVLLKTRAGDRVAQGQVLAVIDSPDLAARLVQEQATLQSVSTDYRRAQLDGEHQHELAEETSRQAKVDHNTATRELERARKAFELGAYSELQMLKAQDQLDKAQFAMEQAERSRKTQPEQSRFEVESKRALHERQRLLVNDLQRQIETLQVRSPVDGQVGQVQVADRATVAKDAPLMSVVDLERLELEINVPESLARELAVDIPAEISGGGGQWQGEIAGVAPEVVAGEVKARIRFKDATPEGLRQSQRLSVRLVLDRKPDVLTVARGPWFDQDGGRVAYVLNDDFVERRPIRSGKASTSSIEILDGLKAGDRIVVSGTDIFENQIRLFVTR
jgi:HlyD family secretion protein